MKCQIKHTFLSPELFLSEHYFIPTKSIMSRSMFEWNILKVCVTNMLKWGGTNHHVITIKRNRVNFSLPATTLRRETHLNLHHEHRAKPCKIHLFMTGVSTEASFAAPMELLTLGEKKKEEMTEVRVSGIGFTVRTTFIIFFYLLWETLNYSCN